MLLSAHCCPMQNKTPYKKTLSTLTIGISSAFLLMLTGCNSVENKVSVPPAAEPVNSSVVVVDSMAKSASLDVASPVAKAEGENYAEIERNAVHRTSEDAISTFSIDTDTGSYANVRRFINQGNLPPKDAVRVEELINYFTYDFSNAKRLTDGNTPAPFVVDTEVVQAPWQTQTVNSNQIIKIGIKAVDDVSSNHTDNLPPANLVFLVDVSGSMNDTDKLQLAKASLKMLTKQLREQDTITLITYAGNTEVVLPATRGNQTRKILSAIDKLNANGSTNGEAAIKLAYEQAQDNFKKEGINRILMLTDGDFNVGVSSVNDMLDIIERGRNTGISLSTFGFGQGNYNDYMMEQVADTGNGNYSYIDSLNEAKKVFIDEMSSTFNTVAKDVKVQVEFNPNTVSEWRLIGYENRVLADEDFNNDRVDAGELGAGKSVVALFEITPAGKQGWLGTKRYGNDAIGSADLKAGNELAYLKIRYKEPNSDTSKLLTQPIMTTTTPASPDTQFALAVAGYGQRLVGSKYIGKFDFADAHRLAKSSLQANTKSKDIEARREFVALVDLAEALD